MQTQDDEGNSALQEAYVARQPHNYFVALRDFEATCEQYDRCYSIPVQNTECNSVFVDNQCHALFVTPNNGKASAYHRHISYIKDEPKRIDMSFLKHLHPQGLDEIIQQQVTKIKEAETAVNMIDAYIVNNVHCQDETRTSKSYAYDTKYVLLLTARQRLYELRHAFHKDQANQFTHEMQERLLSTTTGSESDSITHVETIFSKL
jgi:hypothetical protein